MSEPKPPTLAFIAGQMAETDATSPAFHLALGDCIEVMQSMPDESVNCIITSPPYWGMRDYQVKGQIGMEDSLDLFIEKMSEVFSECRRILTADGTLWLNLGDAYAGAGAGSSTGLPSRVPDKRPSSNNVGGWRGNSRASESMFKSGSGLKRKDLIGIPWRVALRLHADGWFLRSDIIWSKPNPMPASAKDRPTLSHEYIFLMTKNGRYFYDWEAISSPVKYESVRRSQRQQRASGERQAKHDPTGLVNNPEHMRQHYAEKHLTGASGLPRVNRRTVWEFCTARFDGAHFATYPEALIRDCVKAGCPAGGIVFDPFTGSGTTGAVAMQEGRHFIGAELSPEYHAMAILRLEENHARASEAAKQTDLSAWGVL